MRAKFVTVLCAAAAAALAGGSCDPRAERRGTFSALALARADAAAAAVDAARLRTLVEEISAARGRDVAVTPPWSDMMSFTHHESGAYVRAQFGALGLTPVVEHSEDDGLDVDNIYVDVRGTARPDEIVLLTAHYDAWFTGADDNATGVAVLIEAARVLRAAPGGRTVRIVAFDREEEGLIGANRYAEAHESDRVVMMVNLDSVGYATDAPDSQSAPTGLSLRSVGNFILAIANGPASDAIPRAARLSRAEGRAVEFVGLASPNDSHYPVGANFLRSDHSPFWRRGVPAVFVTDTTNFRNDRYHTPRDTPDTVNYDFFTRVGRLVVGVVAGYAEVE